MTQRAALLDFLSTTLLSMPDDLVGAGFTHAQVRRAVEDGDVLRYARGVYMRTESIDTHRTDAAVLTFMNGGDCLFCLLSAMAVHALGDDDPPHYWVATTRPTLRSDRHLPVRPVRWRGFAREEGVEVERILGVDVRTTSPARTVVDLLRTTHLLGTTSAVKALHDYVRLGLDLSDVWDLAKGLGCLKRLELVIRAAEEFRESVPVRGL